LIPTWYLNTAPEEVYPAELRGYMLIENNKFNARRAPEEHNKKKEVID
jgi:hypothetical protein